MPLPIIVWLIFSAAAPVRSAEPTNHVRSAAEAAREEAKQRRAKLPLAKGTLKEVDLLRHQLKVATEDGVRMFTYTARTYMFRDKDKITPDKMKVGEIVALRFETDKDGNIVVTRIKTYSATPTSDAPLSNPPASTNQPVLDDSLAR